jgi:electron transport complex protein RnfC
MVKLAEHKHESINCAIERLPAPPVASIPLIQHLGKACSALVKPGDTVLLGQKIAASEAYPYAPIHASVSGKVTAIEDAPHPVLGRSKAIIIENDNQDKSETRNPKSETQIHGLTPEQIRAMVFEAGIVGMGGASFPTHIKLQPPKPVDTLIINGAECEPYLTADYRLMVEKTREIIQGIELVARCLGVKLVYIAIEDNKPEAIEKFRAVSGGRLAVGGRKPETANRTPQLVVLKSQYPQGGERQLIKSVLGKEVPSGKLPFDIGVVVQNVATVFAIYEAVYLGKPLYERVVTVAGSCVANPKNLLARIGTPLKALIDFCGLKDEPAKIIVGGPMMGIAQFSDQAPVIKSTGGVLLFNKKEAEAAQQEYCIRCGACVRECPAGLSPCLLGLLCEKGLWEQAKELGVLDCIECGLCAYVCPANRGLVQAIKRAKLEVAR